jgi:glycosyltransferase involved in cell wall biosynthesis
LASHFLVRTERPVVSVLVPAYKEEEHIEATLRGIALALRAVGVASQILVVVDAVQGDGTLSQVRKIAEEYHEVRVIAREGRKGVGDAIVTGIRAASGALVIPVMGDQSEAPSDIVRLVQVGMKHDIVFTNRFKHGRPLGYPVLKYIANRYCNLAVKSLFRIPYCDTTNAFKSYNKKILDRIELSSKGFEVFLEIPLKAMTLPNLSTTEIDVTHSVRQKKAPKLSVLSDGYKYVWLMLLMRKLKSGKKRLRPKQ